jgi:putative peptidoglycan lipid II flippase
MGLLHRDSRLVQRIAGFRDSTNGRIMRAAVTIAGLVCLVKIVSLAKEMLVARRFGAGDALDAFYVAVLLPSFLSGVMASSFNAAFIPTYIEVRERDGRVAAQRLSSSVSVLGLAVLIVLVLLLGLSQRWTLPLLGSSFGPAKLRIARLLFFVALCSFVVGGVSSLWRALLNAHECFALTALSPIMNPLMVLAVLLIAGTSWGIYALAAGAVAGTMGELSISCYALRNRGIALIPRWYGLDAPLRQVVAQTAPVVAGALLLGCSTLVDQAMAAMLGTGSVSALNYSNKLLSMILSIGVTSLSVAMLPSFSRLSAKEDWSGMRHVLVTYTGIIALVTIPLTVFIVMFSEPLVAMFYQGGAFTWRDTHLVSGVQTLLCLQLPFYALSILYVNAISSLKRNQILMFGTGISVVSNVVLNIIFMRMFGLPGIALSTSMVQLTTCCYLGVMCFRSVGQREAVVAASYGVAAANSAT